MSALPELARLALIALADANGGTLHEQDVIEAARDRASPLHALFEWDNRRAAEQYRVAQARALIRMVRVEVITETITFQPPRLPLFGRNPVDGGYATVAWLRRDDAHARESAIIEFQKAAQALRRAHGLAVQLGLGSQAVATISALVANVRQSAGLFGSGDENSGTA